MSIRDFASEIELARADAVTGPSPSSLPRTISTTAVSASTSVVEGAAAEGVAAESVATASGNTARNRGRRSMAIQIDAPGAIVIAAAAVARLRTSSRVTRRCAVRSPSNPAQPGWRSTSGSVKNVSHNSASCNSSAFVASGHASSRTR